MAKAKKTPLARFLVTFFDNGAPKYVAGQVYPLDEDTERRIALGDAVLTEEDGEPFADDGVPAEQVSDAEPASTSGAEPAEPAHD